MLAGKKEYRRDIDGLRAFAVLSVIAFHAFPAWLPGGFIGVDVFFVISGYLISGHIFAALDARTFSLADFYRKRTRRIFPALVTVLIACLALGWFALLVDEYRQLGLHVAGGAGFVSNLILWSESGYFDTETATKPLLHLWSLGIEEQFYIVWPLLAWALWRAGLRSVTAIVLLGAVSFAINTTYFQTDPSTAFYSPAARFWELLVGAAISQWDKAPASYKPALHHAASIAGAVLLGASLLLIHEGNGFPGWWALLPVLGTGLVLFAGPGAFLNRTIGAKPLVAIGLISYPLYLWHWPLLSFARIIEGDTPDRNVRIGLVIATFVLAAATYYLVERPLRFGRHANLKLTVLVAAMVLVGGTGYGIFRQDGMPDRSAVAALTKSSAQFGSSIWQYTSNDACIDRYPFEEATRYTYWFCMLSDDSEPEILLLGSSFANHHFPGVLSQEAFRGQTVLSIGACAPMMIPPTDEIPTSNAPCERAYRFNQQEYIKDLVARTPSLKLAVLDGIYTNGVASADETLAVKQWVDFLESRGLRVVVFLPHFYKPGDIKGCFARPFQAPQKSCDIAGIELTKVRNDIQPLVESIEQSNPSVVYFDQNVVFCQSNPCSFVFDGMPLIRDDTGHYSQFGSTLLWSLFTSWAAKNAPELLDHAAARRIH